jgi:hypothetical protein
MLVRVSRLDHDQVGTGVQAVRPARGPSARDYRVALGKAMTAGLFLWVIIALVSTSVAKPVFIDCYPRATWNGRMFVPLPSGEWRCLGDK